MVNFDWDGDFVSHVVSSRFRSTPHGIGIERLEQLTKEMSDLLGEFAQIKKSLTDREGEIRDKRIRHDEGSLDHPLSMMCRGDVLLYDGIVLAAEKHAASAIISERDDRLDRFYDSNRLRDEYWQGATVSQASITLGRSGRYQTDLKQYEPDDDSQGYTIPAYDVYRSAHRYQDDGECILRVYPTSTTVMFTGIGPLLRPMLRPKRTSTDSSSTLWAT
jgi:hypothetical protein